MQSASKFLFENCFDHPAEPEVEEDAVEVEEPVVQGFTEEDIAAARAQGFVEGRTEGIAEMQSGIDQRVTALLEDMIGKLQNLADLHDGAHRETRRQMLGLSAAISAKIVPEIARPHAGSVIESVLRDCLPKLLEEPRVVMRVHSTMLEELRDGIDQVAVTSGYPGNVILIADDELGHGDCRVEWADGGAERSERKIWAAIDAALETHLGNGYSAGMVIDGVSAADCGDPASVPTEAAPSEERENG